jgi:light-regulated signal transduction histidine kinase (bacteriophytochrome)
MGESKAHLPQRELHLLEGLLRIPSGSVQATLTRTSDLVAGATGADKIDAFLYEQARDSLVAERFVSGKHRQGGLGLGLYLAKRIAAMHGGDLTVDSALGQGARFTLTLPATRDKQINVND